MKTFSPILFLFIWLTSISCVKVIAQNNINIKVDSTYLPEGKEIQIKSFLLPILNSLDSVQSSKWCASIYEQVNAVELKNFIKYANKTYLTNAFSYLLADYTTCFSKVDDDEIIMISECHFKTEDQAKLAFNVSNKKPKEVSMVDMSSYVVSYRVNNKIYMVDGLLHYTKDGHFIKKILSKIKEIAK